VRHPRREQGADAVALLQDLLDGKSPAVVDRVLEPRLIVRDSCAVPPR
jgi:DNA-binding LacI/PurR family transcriptional regulator